MQLATRAEVHVPLPPERVFDVAVACETFPRILRPLGPIPGIAQARMLDAPGPATGARRRIELTDGSSLDEELLAVERPSRHTYRWLGPPARPLGLLVRRGTGDWSFVPEAGGTRVVWSYRFELSSPLAAPLAWPVVLLFRRWMAAGLEALRAELASRP